MDIWGTGCVLFEILSLFPLFPGNDEPDQINKIHNILGTPSEEIFRAFQKHATHMEVKFKAQGGTGINNLIPHVSEEAKDLISRMLTYKENERITAKQAICHPWFRDLRSQEKSSILSGSLAFADEQAEGELKQTKRSYKDPTDYQRSLRKLQQGSNKNLEAPKIGRAHV